MLATIFVPFRSFNSSTDLCHHFQDAILFLTYFVGCKGQFQRFPPVFPHYDCFYHVGQGPSVGVTQLPRCCGRSHRNHYSLLFSVVFSRVVLDLKICSGLGTDKRILTFYRFCCQPLALSLLSFFFLMLSSTLDGCPSILFLGQPCSISHLHDSPWVKPLGCSDLAGH